jgi:hypothetical protein
VPARETRTIGKKSTPVQFCTYWALMSSSVLVKFLMPNGNLTVFEVVLAAAAATVRRKARRSGARGGQRTDRSTGRLPTTHR